MPYIVAQEKSRLKNKDECLHGGGTTSAAQQQHSQVTVQYNAVQQRGQRTLLLGSVPGG